MSQHLLNDAQIGTVVEHVRRTRVTQNVRRQVSPHTGPFSVSNHDRPGRLATQSPTSPVQEDRLGIATFVPSRGLEFGTTVAEPSIHGTSGTTSDRNETLLGPFAVQAHQSGIEIEITDRQTAHFGDPCPRCVEEFEESPITQGHWIVSHHGTDQRFHFVFGQWLRSTGWNPHTVHVGRGIVGATPFGDQKTMEVADRRHLSSE